MLICGTPFAASAIQRLTQGDILHLTYWAASAVAGLFAVLLSIAISYTSLRIKVQQIAANLDALSHFPERLAKVEQWIEFHIELHHKDE